MNCCDYDCNQGRDCPARQSCELPIDMIEPERTTNYWPWVFLVSAAIWGLLYWFVRG